MTRRPAYPTRPSAELPSRLTWSTWTAVSFITLTFWLGQHEGLYGLDDFFYARYAHQLVAGSFKLPLDPLHQLHDPLRHRPAIYGPVALLFRSFGVTIWVATLWPLLATLLTSALLLLLRLPGWRSGLAAAGAVAVLGLGQHTLWLATYLYGDNVAMLLALASVAALAQYRATGRHPLGWAAAFVLATLAAWLAKETIVWYAPAYLVVAGLDWRRHQHRRFWLAAFGLGTVVLAAYFGLYAALTGDPWQRFHEIETTNRFLSSGNFADKPLGALLARLTWKPVAMLAETGLAVVAWPALLAAAQPGWRRRLALRGPDAAEGLWLLLALLAVGQWWLGTTSLQFWNPPALGPRFFTVLLPPLAVLAGMALHGWYRGTIRGGAVALGFVVLAVVARNSVSLQYLLLAALAWWFGAERRRPRPPAWAVVAALVAVMAARPAYQLTKPSVSAWREQRTIIQEHLTGADGPAVVFTDDHLLDNYPFWYGFRPPPALRWRRFAAVDSLGPDAPRQGWVLLNEATLRNPDMPKLRGINPAAVLARFPKRTLVAQRGPVSLYRVMW